MIFLVFQKILSSFFEFFVIEGQWKLTIGYWVASGDRGLVLRLLISLNIATFHFDLQFSQFFFTTLSFRGCLFRLLLSFLRGDELYTRMVFFVQTISADR